MFPRQPVYPGFKIPTASFPPTAPKGAVGDVNSTARGSGARYNSGKAPLDLIPLAVIARSIRRELGPKLVPGSAMIDVLKSLEALGDFQTKRDVAHLERSLGYLKDHWSSCAKVFDYGRKKYAEWNWAKGMDWNIPLACAARHALQYIDGEATDAESGESHIGHMMCNLVMLRTFVDSWPSGDNLPDPELFIPPGPAF
ncbi:dATP/dGTP diphosphohydrolase domain-containing protein [Stenotrophomonas oahuensis]|uniref:DUF5664 domain-containing protein n=1 Tax=Stenotrophomonas oahuensis TaxID=3003271 RepID=A0ABY9YNH8_9GAMM|nr:dATP/dGTP diphosphohydrolase domain-containing protein [Stenotrophomonas sp. A5586]WNH52451.1 DUF5664 domain-containing protein [Stenotrophomonas sp. A5586]